MSGLIVLSYLALNFRRNIQTKCESEEKLHFRNLLNEVASTTSLIKSEEKNSKRIEGERITKLLNEREAKFKDEKKQEIEEGKQTQSNLQKLIDTWDSERDKELQSQKQYAQSNMMKTQAVFGMHSQNNDKVESHILNGITYGLSKQNILEHRAALHRAHSLRKHLQLLSSQLGDKEVKKKQVKLEGMELKTMIDKDYQDFIKLKEEEQRNAVLKKTAVLGRIK